MSGGLVEFESEFGQRVKKLLDEKMEGHEKFQMQHFILDMAGFTDWGKYRQAVREVTSRWDGIKGTLAELEKLKAAFRLHAYRAKKARETGTEEGELKAQLYEVHARKNELSVESQERQLERQLDEMRFFVEKAEEYGRLVEGKDREKLTAEFWEEKTKRLILQHTIWGGTNIDSIIEMVMVFPEEQRKNLLAFADEMRFRAKVNEIGLHGAAIKALEAPSNIVTLNGKK